MRLKDRLLNYFIRKIKNRIEQMDKVESYSFVPMLQSRTDRISIGHGTRFIHPEKMEIGENCTFGQDCRIETIIQYNEQIFNPKLKIGNNVSFEDNCHVGCAHSVVIGSGTMIASRVYISDHNHGSIVPEDLSFRPALRPLSSKPVIIGDNVWIGENVSILPGITLGDNVIVGANSVVTHSFESGTIIAGCPAKIIRNML